MSEMHHPKVKRYITVT